MQGFCALQRSATVPFGGGTFWTIWIWASLPGWAKGRFQFALQIWAVAFGPHGDKISQLIVLVHSFSGLWHHAGTLAASFFFHTLFLHDVCARTVKKHFHFDTFLWVARLHFEGQTLEPGVGKKVVSYFWWAIFPIFVLSIIIKSSYQWWLKSDFPFDC